MRLVQRFIAVLLSLVVMMSAFGRASVAWACEGRVCSSDAARCCCASPEDERDRSCLIAKKESAGACKGRCACTAVVLKAAAAATLEVPKAVHALVLFDTLTADLAEPAGVAQSFILLDAPQVRAIPPPDGLPDPPCVEHASLRAPPATA